MNIRALSVYSLYQNYYNTMGINAPGAAQTKNAIDIWSQYNKKNTQQIDYSFVGFVTGVKTSAASLKNTISGLRNNRAMFAGREVSSSDESKMTVKQTGPPSSSLVTPVSVRIEQLAAGQKNSGTALNSGEAFGGEAGVRQIEIETGGKKHTVSFEIAEGDTNRVAQDKMAAAINSANIGVKASVSADGETSALNLEAVGTGKSAAFTVRDVTGDAAAVTGADNVTRSAQDAAYYINSSVIRRTSASNTVDLGGGVTAEFKQASDEAVKINRKPNTDGALDAVKRFADSYNSLYKVSRDNGELGERLFSRLVSTSRTYKSALARVGITFDDKGEMTVDEDAAKRAAENGSLERFFNDGASGGNFGFLNQLSRLSDDARLNTGKYINRSAVMSELFSGVYSMFGNATGSIPYGATPYGSIGMVLDFMA